MKNSLKTTAMAIALMAVFASSAFAAVSQSELNRSVKSKLSPSSNITVHERNGVVTLTGYYENASDRNRAAEAAKSVEGVDKVHNLAFTSS